METSVPRHHFYLIYQIRISIFELRMVCTARVLTFGVFLYRAKFSSVSKSPRSWQFQRLGPRYDEGQMGMGGYAFLTMRSRQGSGGRILQC